MKPRPGLVLFPARTFSRGSSLRLWLERMGWESTKGAGDVDGLLQGVSIFGGEFHVSEDPQGCLLEEDELGRGMWNGLVHGLLPSGSVSSMLSRLNRLGLTLIKNKKPPDCSGG